MSTPFHEHQHAVEFDQRAARSEARAQLASKLVQALELTGDEWVLDVATGTGRFARPVAHHLKRGKTVGVDEALAMLRVGHEQKSHEPIPNYLQVAGAAESLPFRDGAFRRAFVAMSLHHFGDPPRAVRETRRVLQSGGRFVVLDPVLLEPHDDLDHSVHELVNRVFRRTHGESFRFLSAEGIGKLLTAAGFRIARADLDTFSFDQDSVEEIPTGRHWLEIVEQMEKQPEPVGRRFQRDYVRFQRKGEKITLTGRLSFALVSAET